MGLCGLKVLEVRYLSPVPEGAKLKELEAGEYSMAYTIETLNRNIRQLNDLLYGHQDYCVIAEAA